MRAGAIEIGERTFTEGRSPLKRHNQMIYFSYGKKSANRMDQHTIGLHMYTMYKTIDIEPLCSIVIFFGQRDDKKLFSIICPSNFYS